MVFAQTLIPGTQRDSLYALDGLLANQTLIRPEMVSPDTASASEIVFGLAWTLGYRWAPRLADLPDQRLWYIDPHADGPAVIEGQVPEVMTWRGWRGSAGEIWDRRGRRQGRPGADRSILGQRPDDEQSDIRNKTS